MITRLLPAAGALAAICSSVMASPPLVLAMRDDKSDAAAVVTAVALSADGSRVFAGGDDHRVRIWDATSGRRIATLSGHKDWVRAITLGGQPDTVATVAADHTLCIWDVKHSGARPTTTRLAEGALLAVAAHPDGRQLASAGFGDRLRLFDLRDSDAAPKEFPCPCEDTRAVAISPNGRWLAAAGRNGVLRLWDFEATGGSVDLPTDGRRVRAMAFSPDGETLAIGGDSPAIRLFRVNDDDAGFGGPQATTDQLEVRPGKIHSLAFLDNSRLVAGDSLNGIRLWNSDSLAKSGELTGHTGTVAALACSNDGRRLASGSFDTTVRVWDIGDDSLPATTAQRNKNATR